MKLRWTLACSSLVLGAWACTPDLDALIANYAGGAAGMGGSLGGGSGGSGGSGGNGEGGVVDPTGGTGGSTAGTGGSRGGSGGEAGSDASGGTGGEPAPTCENDDRDEDESDVDCGGSSDCDRCDEGKRCSRDRDCESDFCLDERCAEPTCSDGHQNQDETGTDCGGSCAPTRPCELGVACEEHADCETAFCDDDVCADHCTSKAREADETGVDCGGSTCGPCADGLGCEEHADCQSRVCEDEVCQAPSCDDETLNQDESDVDCGGSCAEDRPCALEARCNRAADCASYVCASDRCAPDLEVADEDSIDGFEDGNTMIQPINMRSGSWYPFGDAFGSSTYGIVAIPGGRGPLSAIGLHTQGSGYTNWGSGVGCDLNNPGAGKQPYDASAYTGVTFWARASGSLPLNVVLPDGNTDPSGGVCTTCDHHWLKSILLTETWRRHTVLFTELALEPGGVPVPTAPDIARLISLQFRTNPSAVYDYWIDDIAFVR